MRHIERFVAWPRRFILILTFALLPGLLSGCATKVKVFVSQNYTDSGHINTQNLQLGYLYLWDRNNNSINRKWVLELDPSNHVTYRQPNASVSMASSSEFKMESDVELTPEQKASLSGDVASRTSIEMSGLTIDTVRGPRKAIIDSLNRYGNSLIEELELPRAVRSSDELLYVLVYDITTTNSTVVTVDNKRAAGTEFDTDISAAKGKIKFSIADASKIDLGEFPAFARYQVFRPFINSQGNYDLETMTERFRRDLIRDFRQTN